MSIKVFCDIADLSNIKKFNRNKFVKGFTTNPSLMRKAGAKDYKSYSKQNIFSARAIDIQRPPKKLRRNLRLARANT